MKTAALDVLKEVSPHPQFVILFGTAKCWGSPPISIVVATRSTTTLIGGVKNGFKENNFR